MMYWWGSDMTGWAWLAMTVTVILFWALVIAGVAALVRYVRGTDDTTPVASRPTPEQMLAERYACGEIDETEYRRGMDNLKAMNVDRGSASRQ
ncbi:SHOCT domain-containing protein [Pseudonocardia sp. CA-142604]|uniref:SHOCT domain-containing protein n=1 Tax=Pseudonocardia sp. CA-142604 TaxID=3240024 RepID=UPI003D926EE9